MVVSTPPSTVDDISGDDMETSESLESGIEGSIKRCEALLSMLPATLGKSFDSDALSALQETSNKKLRKARAYLNMNMKNLMEGLEPEWNKNMGLLSNISMSRDISSSPATSWQSYSLCNETSTESYNTDNVETEAQPRVFMCSTSETRSRKSKDESSVTHHQRRCIKSRTAGGMRRSSFGVEDWTERVNSKRGTSGSSVDEEENQSLDASEDVSNRASSESGESAESAVTYSSAKEVNHEKQSSFSVTSEVGKFFQPGAIVRDSTAAPSLIYIELGNEQESLEEESLEEDLVSEEHSPPTRKITISLLNRSQETSEGRRDERSEATAGSIAEGDALPKPSPQIEQPEKHSSSSSSTVSGPNMTEPRKFTPQGNKNAAELKPTGLPTNYRKTDAPPQKEWSSSLKLEESKSKHKRKPSRHERLKMHTMATVARLSIPKFLAAQRVSHVKTVPEAKRNVTLLKLDSVMRLSTPKIMATQKVCQVHHTGPTTPERSSKPRGGKKTEAGSKCSAPFVGRLGDIQERINSCKRAKKIREKEERDLCSFRPNINSTKYLNVEGYQPIEKRLDCIREQKDKAITKARDQEAKDLGITFRPELNANSVRILKERAHLRSQLALDINESGSTTPRNSSNCWADLPDLRTKAGDLSRSVSVCTFVPEINANTELILAGTALEGCDFLTRQQKFLDRIEQRKRLKQQDLPQFTFQPQRGNADFILSCSPLFKIDENLSAMCERLSSSDNQRHLCIQQQITDNYYSQFAFHPHVDETSRLIGRNPSIETLYSDQRAKHRKDLLRRLAQEEFQRTCTFRPMVRVPNIVTEEAVLEERKKIKLERKKQEDRERISKELEKLAECTFKPVINPWPPKEADNGLQIKGVQRHLELQRLAKQMKIDQAEWEKKVFFSHQNNERPKQQYTIPKPFNFHTRSCNDHCPGSPVIRRN